MKTIKLTFKKKEEERNIMKETTYTNLLEAALTSRRSTKDILDMLRLVQKLKLAKKVLDNSDAVLIGNKLHYLKDTSIEELA